MLCMVHPFLHLVSLLWLSLPKFQGASVLYERFFLPAFIEYEVEIDEQINVQSGRMRQSLLQYMRNGGNELIQTITKTSVFALTLSRQLVFANESRSLFAGSSMIIEEIKPETYCAHSEAKESWTIEPQHSLSDLSNSSKEDNGYISDYISNFIGLLSKGLYVFSKTKLKGSLLEAQHSKDRFQLKIFAIHMESLSFIIADVDSTNDTKRKPLRISFSDIKKFRQSGLSEIKFVFSVESHKSKTLHCEIALADTDDCKALLRGLNKCLPYLKNKVNVK